MNINSTTHLKYFQRGRKKGDIKLRLLVRKRLDMFLED